MIWDLPDTRRSAPWKSDYLCINPTFPILAVEFAGHVFLYLDDSEARIVQVAVPQPEDGPLANVFGAE